MGKTKKARAVKKSLKPGTETAYPSAKEYDSLKKKNESLEKNYKLLMEKLSQITLQLEEIRKRELQPGEIIDSISSKEKKNLPERSSLMPDMNSFNKIDFKQLAPGASPAQNGDQQQKIDESQQKIDEPHPKIDESQQKIEELHPKIEELHPKSEEYLPKIEESKSKSDECLPKSEESQQKIDESQQKIEELHQKSEEFQPKSEESMSKIDDLLSENDDFRSKKDELGLIKKERKDVFPGPQSTSANLIAQSAVLFPVTYNWLRYPVLSFAFNGENMIGGFRVHGTKTIEYFRRERRLAAELIQIMNNYYPSVLEKLNVSRREFFLVVNFLSAELKAHRLTMPFASRLAFYLTYLSKKQRATKSEFENNFSVSGSGCDRLIKCLKKQGWVRVHLSITGNYYYITPVGSNFVRTALTR